MEPTEQCGEYAASFIPRWGMYYSYVLPKGHKGEHRAGGECLKHGKYVMGNFEEIPQCPQWPDCLNISAEKS